MDFSGGLSGWKKSRIKKIDPQIRVQNSGVQDSLPRIRPRIRVRRCKIPPCRNLSLTELRVSLPLIVLPLKLLHSNFVCSGATHSQRTSAQGQQAPPLSVKVKRGRQKGDGKQKLSDFVFSAALHNIQKTAQARHLLLMRFTHCVSPGELGRSEGVSPRSAWPILGVHSA